MEAAPRQATVALMQHRGMDVDQAEVQRQKAKLEKEIENVEAEVEAQDVVQRYKGDHKGVFNPLSGPDTLSIFKDYLKREEVYVEGGKNVGRYSVDRHVLEKIDHPLAKQIVHLRHVSKMKSTYVDGLELGVGKLIYPDANFTRLSTQRALKLGDYLVQTLTCRTFQNVLTDILGAAFMLLLAMLLWLLITSN